MREKPNGVSTSPNPNPCYSANPAPYATLAPTLAPTRPGVAATLAGAGGAVTLLGRRACLSPAPASAYGAVLARCALCRGGSAPEPVYTS